MQTKVRNRSLFTITGCVCTWSRPLQLPDTCRITHVCRLFPHRSLHGKNTLHRQCFHWRILRVSSEAEAILLLCSSKFSCHPIQYLSSSSSHLTSWCLSLLFFTSFHFSLTVTLIAFFFLSGHSPSSHVLFIHIFCHQINSSRISHLISFMYHLISCKDAEICC